MYGAPLRLLLALCVFGASVGVLQFLIPSAPYSEARTIAQGADSFQALSERFARLAEEKGGAYAFEVLKRTALPPNTDVHLLGHVVGDVLYEQEGLRGITLCSQDFRNACSHSIVIGALNEYGGEAALTRIRDACVEAPGGEGAYTMCYHGLGHGVFAFFGYALPETVRFCEKTGTEAHRHREYVECIGGAVMELMGGGGHDREKWLVSRERYLSENDPLSPCMSALIPQEAKPICLIYLTPWLWERAGIDLGVPDDALFPRAFAACDAIPRSAQVLRDACFGGFGKEFVPLSGGRDIRRMDALSDVEYARAIGWCLLADPDDGKAACVREELSSIFWGGENDPEASLRFCSLVPGALEDACFEALARNIASYVRGEKRGALCARLPEAHRSACLYEEPV